MKGAFTGATQLKKGKVELAQGGTVFLDEVGDMALELQAKLLRFLQEREIERVGGIRTIPVDTASSPRPIATWSRPCAPAASARICITASMSWPSRCPLRQRQDDIPALAHFYLQRFAADTKKPSRAWRRRCRNASSPIPGPAMCASWPM